ncbi:MAG TPA: HAMP domain-containing sensor histidine kinase [Burkholderiales bacterium]|nr:HAMP domain-containing sensor histidine kinase [Burkholderiales bacterium]
MSQDSFFRSTSFRLLAWYAAVFGASVAVLLVVVYWIALAAIDEQLSDSIERESQVLVELYRGRGLDSVARAIQLRVVDLRAPRRYYLLQNGSGERVAGNLPPMDPTEGETVLPASYLYPNRSAKADNPADAYPVVAQGQRLDNGEFLLVGESRYRVVKAREAIVRAFSWGIAITVLLAGIGGAALRGGFLRRIEEINRTTRSIMDGDLSQRMRTRGSGDEMDLLALNLNAMLGRIQALMESLKRVSDDIAHDLRTPLSRLRHRLEVARDNAGPDGDPVIEQSISELDAILETFSALLRIAQIEAGARRAGFSDVNLSQIASAVSDAYVPVAEDRTQQLEIIIDPVPSIQGDRELLTQMMANLIENPIRHCPPGVGITVHLRQEAGMAVLSVADTGPGIPEPEREKVFRRFYRLESSRTTPGSGLGLALVKAVADLHGASVELSDNRPGLRVTVRFHAASAAAQKSHQQANRSSPSVVA